MRVKPIVLSIDDDPGFRKIVEAVLTGFGLYVRSVPTVDRFLRLMSELRPDLLLIDLNIPGANGLELVKTVSDKLNTESMVMVISGVKDKELIARSLEAGANDFLFKPLERVLLATKLSQFIRTRELLDHGAERKAINDENISEAKLDFEGQIDEVDEAGIRFRSATLITNGTVLKVNSELFRKMGVKDGKCMITVTNTWIADGMTYGGYGEFDGMDAEFLQSIRRWLAGKAAG